MITLKTQKSMLTFYLRILSGPPNTNALFDMQYDDTF